MFRAEDPSRIITICPARSFSHAFAKRRRFVIRAGTRSHVRLQRRTAQTRRVAVAAPASGDGQLGGDIVIAGEHPGEIHQLAESDALRPCQHRRHLGWSELSPR